VSRSDEINYAMFGSRDLGVSEMQNSAGIRFFGRRVAFRLLLAAMLAVFSAPSWAEEPEQLGRFQLVMKPESRGEPFLLDTGTGKVWRLVQHSELNGTPVVWEPMDRLEGPFNYMALAQKYGVAPKYGVRAKIKPVTAQAPAQ
jgi:hypothetical protein